MRIAIRSLAFFFLVLAPLGAQNQATPTASQRTPATDPAQVIEFLGHLKRHVRRPLLVIWDRLSAHKSRMTQEWIREQKGWIHTQYLPAYAPELNPVEYLWGYWKQHELPNVCPRDWWELDNQARRALKRIRRRPRIIVACWEQSKLPL